MKPQKSKIFENLETSRKFPTEPKVMKELHKIREKMAKLSVEERANRFKKASEEYKRLMAS